MAKGTKGSGGQKFIGRNRAPRVQIEYAVETNGSQEKVELPFVMGVMTDLSGKPREELPPVSERKFHEIDIDNFDHHMESTQPRVAFAVDNTLTGEGQLAVDITFTKLDDFNPAAIAQNVEPLRQLLQARTELNNLLTYMDGKIGAENLLGEVLKDPTLLKSLASAPAQTSTAATDRGDNQRED